jgi:hypothetical protein
MTKIPLHPSRLDLDANPQNVRRGWRQNNAQDVVPIARGNELQMLQALLVASELSQGLCVARMFDSHNESTRGQQDLAALSITKKPQFAKGSVLRSGSTVGSQPYVQFGITHRSISTPQAFLKRILYESQHHGHRESCKRLARSQNLPTKPSKALNSLATCRRYRPQSAR